MISDDYKQPSENEPICVITFEITRLLLGGDPEGRSSFWKRYRQLLEVNRRTNYQNDRVNICRPHLIHLKDKLHIPHFYREKRLTAEKIAPVIREESINDQSTPTRPD